MYGRMHLIVDEYIEKVDRYEYKYMDMDTYLDECVCG